MSVISTDNCDIYLQEKEAGSKPIPSDAVQRDYGRHWTPVHLDFLAKNVDEIVKKVLQLGGTHEGGESGVKDAARIVIRSYRRGEVVGDHTVSYENEVERIEFTHHAWSRECFAMGALRAAAWVCSKKPRLYDMQDVLGLSSL
mgnify:CR=1 FL=1